LNETGKLNAADFIESSGFLRVQEKRLLSGSALERMIDAPNLAEVFRMLSQNSDYDFSAASRVDEAEPMLKAELARVYGQARGLAKGSPVVTVLSCRYDFHNVKAALKAKHFPQRTPVPYVPVGDVPVEKLQVIERADANLEKAGLPGYVAAAVKAAEAAFAESGNPQDIDIAVDRVMFSTMLAFCKAMANGFITGYVKTMIDLTNLKTLLRVRDMQKGTAFLGGALAEGGSTPISFFIENYAKTPSAMVPVFYYRYFGEAMRQGVEAYEKTGNFSALERLLDSMLVEYLKKVKYLSYGPEILFAYLLSKENEIRQIRILLTCKNNDIGPEVLRERLRDNYA
jgi:V/A-type H+-transporting ATPase subunit C